MLNPYELLSTLNLNGLCAEEWWFCHCLFISKKETEVFNKEWLAYMQATKAKINFSKIIKSLEDNSNLIFNPNIKQLILLNCFSLIYFSHFLLTFASTGTSN